jgi:hypothetical protein
LFGFLDDPYHNEKRIALTANANGMVEELLVSDYGEHNMLVYSNRRSFRQLYSKYCRNVLVEKTSNNSANEMILIISYYDTVSNIRNVLRRIGINPDKAQEDKFITLMDSVTAYSCPLHKSCFDKSNNKDDKNVDDGIWTANKEIEIPYMRPPPFHFHCKPYRILSLVGSLLRSLENMGMKGLCVIGDMGSFYLLDRVEELVDYECSLAPRLDNDVRVKAFCCHHREEITRVLTPEQQSNISSHHNRHLLLTSR